MNELTGNRQFHAKFNKVAAAFVNMCLREYGIWPIIFYCGLPGMGIHANMSVFLPSKELRGAYYPVALRLCKSSPLRDAGFEIGQMSKRF